TFEFLVEGPTVTEDSPFYFIEANPRLQVEHTITEEVTGFDLVQAQISTALGQSLAELGLQHPPVQSGTAVQFRITSERWQPGSGFAPASGTLSAYAPPSGRYVRVDGHAAVGQRINPRFDSLLAKLIVSQPAPGLESVLRSAYHVLCEFQIEGVDSTLLFYQTLIQSGLLTRAPLHTRLLDGLTLEADAASHPQRFYATSQTADDTPDTISWADDLEPMISPLPGSILHLLITAGDAVSAGQPLLIIESMKMETVLNAPAAARIDQILVAAGDLISEGQPLLLYHRSKGLDAAEAEQASLDLEHIRPDLAEVFERRAFGLDENRPDAVAKRAARDGRTGRANVDDLCDSGSFVEYGSAIVAAQRSRRSLDDLIARTPADGLIAGFGQINGALFEGDRKQTRCLIMAYDYTVLAGTQGVLNHKKMDRMLRLAEQWEMPIVIFAEGGGGRPGDIDYMGVAQLDVMTFSLFAKLSGRMPRVVIVNGYCFAGNAALAGAADVIIATESASLGMGGPAMIAGGGLGEYHPREVGPVEVHLKNGVVDLLAKDEAAGVAVAKRYLSYFQGRLNQWEAADQRLLRHLIPENRRRVYNIRRLIETLADVDTVLELRAGFGTGILTALIRIEGRPIGLIANNPAHLGGALDVDGCDKMARFMQLCDAFGLPILSLVDTPGIMVGPEAEKEGTVRHAARLFVIGGRLHVPFLAVVLRKGYGLGAQAMCGGSFHVPAMTVSWPTGEFGAMGLEGAVQLGFRKELEAIEDPQERAALYEKMVAEAYKNGKGLNTASYMELDEVIDPAETRTRVCLTLDAINMDKGFAKSRYVDTW
ncbi:MAG: carboxyl transferase domain-containing protein, partial [Chloroflexota bacterium]